MTYATQNDLATRYGERELVQVTDKARPPAGIVDAAVVADALRDADAEIDARVGIRYVVPLPDPVPSIVVDTACRIARYKLHEDKATEKVRKDYEDALKFLADVAAGRANLPGVPDAASGGVAVGGRCAVAAPAVRVTDCVLARMP
jgi:phage gp36-like protein